MKKLFTILMAVMLTSVVFGQVNRPIYRLDQPINGADERTNWVGGNANFEYYTIMEEGEKMAMRLPAAAALPTGDLTITKVKFGWQDHGGTDVPVANPDFNVQIYTGGNGNWIGNSTATGTINRTYDLTVQGELLHQQSYTATANGWQEVVLTEPVAIPNDGTEIWIVIECLGTTVSWVCEPEMNEEWWGQYLDYYNRAPQNPTAEDPGGWVWWTPTYVFDTDNDGENDTYGTTKYPIKALIDNGEAYVAESDWRVDMYSWESFEDQEVVDYIYFDEYALQDSLYLAVGLWNMGGDTCYSDGTLRIYIEDSYVVLDSFSLADLTEEHIAPATEPLSGYIFRYIPDFLGGMMAFSDMEANGLTFPFYVCASFTTEGNDPILDNNTGCVEITNVDPEDGINEVNTTSLNVYPNPACNVINVDNAAGAQISIYNIAGQEVMAIEAANANESINVASLSEGVYVVRVVNGNEVATSKVSIVR